MTKNRREDGLFWEVLTAFKPELRVPVSAAPQKIKADSVVWSDNMVVGEHLSRDMMKKMSKEA